MTQEWLEKSWDMPGFLRGGKNELQNSFKGSMGSKKKIKLLYVHISHILLILLDSNIKENIA